MSRRELVQFQKDVEEEENQEDADKKFFSEQEVRQLPEFVELEKEMESIQQYRVQWIKKYLDRFKNHSSKRELLLEAIEESEEYTKMILGEEKFVPILDKLPELKEIIMQKRAEEEIKLAERKKQEELEKKDVDDS